MTAAGVANEVVRTGVDLLQERSLRVHETPHREHTFNLRDYLDRVEHVLENSLDQDGVDALARKRNAVGVSDEVRQWAPVQIECDDPCAAIRVQRFDPVAHRSRSEEHTSELQSLRHLVCRLLL